MVRTRCLAVALVIGCGVVALGVSACGQSASSATGAAGGSSSSSSVGVTKSSVTFGQTVPESGPAALYGESTAGVRAYFDMVNAQGGVNGRKLGLSHSMTSTSHRLRFPRPAS